MTEKPLNQDELMAELAVLNEKLHKLRGFTKAALQLGNIPNGWSVALDTLQQGIRLHGEGLVLISRLDTDSFAKTFEALAIKMAGAASSLVKIAEIVGLAAVLAKAEEEAARHDPDAPDSDLAKPTGQPN